MEFKPIKNMPKNFYMAFCDPDSFQDTKCYECRTKEEAEKRASVMHDSNLEDYEIPVVVLGRTIISRVPGGGPILLHSISVRERSDGNFEVHSYFGKSNLDDSEKLKEAIRIASDKERFLEVVGEQ